MRFKIIIYKLTDIALSLGKATMAHDIETKLYKLIKTIQDTRMQEDCGCIYCEKIGSETPSVVWTFEVLLAMPLA